MTRDRLKVLREADAIVVEEIQSAGLYRETSQSFAVLLPVQSVGVMGDFRTYENVVAVRAVETDDFMTAVQAIADGAIDPSGVVYRGDDGSGVPGARVYLEDDNSRPESPLPAGWRSPSGF